MALVCLFHIKGKTSEGGGGLEGRRRGTGPGEHQACVLAQTLHVASASLPSGNSIRKTFDPTPVTVISPLSGLGSSSARQEGEGKARWWGETSEKGGGQRTGVCEPLANTIKGDLLSLGLCLLVRSVVNQTVHLTPVGVSVSWLVFL